MTRVAAQEVLKDLRPESLLGALVALLALTLLAAHLYLLGPALAQYRELGRSGSRDRLAVVSAQLEAARAAVQEAERTLEATRVELYGEASELPIEKLESFVIDRLDQLSVQHAVHLDAVKPDPAGSVLMFDEYPYAVEVGGNYFALYEWLQEVEEQLRPMVVSRFELVPEGEEGSVRMKLRLVSYRPRSETP